MFSKGYHRLPIFEGASMINLFTQSQFLKFLDENIDLLGDLAEKNCYDLHLGTLQVDKIIQISSDQPAIEAFRKMQQHNLSAIAVTDEKTGLLCGQLSASDLKGLGTGKRDSDYTLRSLLLPLSIFLPFLRNMQGKPQNYMVWVSPELSLQEIIQHMIQHEVHRVYVLHDEWSLQHKGSTLPISPFELVGVISITDVAQSICDGQYD